MLLGFWTHLYEPILRSPTCKTVGSWSTDWSFRVYLETDVLCARRDDGFPPPSANGPMLLDGGSRFSKDLAFQWICQCGVLWGLLGMEFLGFGIPLISDRKF